MNNPRKLIVLEHPLAEFYKDEGGKGNSLKFHVRSPVPLAEPLPLKCSLYYESFERVEDKEQSILALHCSEYRPYTLYPTSPEAIIEFRIEKVSRRKDGQRFRIFVEPDYGENIPPPSLPIIGVFSEPIVVLSKRKTGERIVSRRSLPSLPIAAAPIGNGGIMILGSDNDNNALTNSSSSSNLSSSSTAGQIGANFSSSASSSSTGTGNGVVVALDASSAGLLKLTYGTMIQLQKSMDSIHRAMKDMRHRITRIEQRNGILEMGRSSTHSNNANLLANTFEMNDNNGSSSSSSSSSGNLPIYPILPMSALNDISVRNTTYRSSTHNSLINNGNLNNHNLPLNAPVLLTSSSENSNNTSSSSMDSSNTDYSTSSSESGDETVQSRSKRRRATTDHHHPSLSTTTNNRRASSSSSSSNTVSSSSNLPGHAPPLLSDPSYTSTYSSGDPVNHPNHPPSTNPNNGTTPSVNYMSAAALGLNSNSTTLHPSTGNNVGHRSFTGNSSTNGGRGFSGHLDLINNSLEMGPLPLDSLLPGVRPITTLQTTYTVTYNPDELLIRPPSPPSHPMHTTSFATSGMGLSKLDNLPDNLSHLPHLSSSSSSTSLPTTFSSNDLKNEMSKLSSTSSASDAPSTGNSATTANLPVTNNGNNNNNTTSISQSMRAARVNVVQRGGMGEPTSIGIFTDDPDLAAGMASSMANTNSSRTTTTGY